jgi:8-hydroxy-5-deazaflavin:NADPH oxidoreductase
MGSPSGGEGQMNIGILGGGNVGSALADAWLRHNHEVMIVTRQPLSWHGNARSGTLEEAVHFGGVVVLALPWQAAFELVPSLDVNGKTVIDCSNGFRGALSSKGSHSSGAEALQARSPGANIVKAFNISGANNMSDPLYPGGRLSMFYRDDNADAKATVRELIGDIGFDPHDLGPLSNTRLMESLAEVWIWLASKGGLGRELGFLLVKRQIGVWHHLPRDGNRLRVFHNPLFR